MRKHDYKKKYSPVHGKHVYKHVYGEGVYDVLSGLRRKLFSKTAQKVANKVAKKATTTAIDKTGNYIGNKAGDKIVKLLQKKQGIPARDRSSLVNPSRGKQRGQRGNVFPSKKLTDYEINERVQRIMSGSGKGVALPVP